MANNLVILESPTKAPTIKGFLGSGYRVVASKGHVRDLPKSTLGVDIENGFAAHYINIRGKGELIKEIKKEVQKLISNPVGYLVGKGAGLGAGRGRIMLEIMSTVFSVQIVGAV